MKIKTVQFCTPVNFGGTLVSASCKPVGDRIGESGTVIELSDDKCFISLSKNVNGIPTTKWVPLTNVACYELLDVAPEKKVESANGKRLSNV